MLVCSKLIHLHCFLLNQMQEIAKVMLLKLDLDLACLRICERESAVWNFSVFIAANLFITWHNSHTLQNAKYFLETYTTGWYNRYLCKPYYGCSNLWSSFTCFRSNLLLLFTISCTGRTGWGVETFAKTRWLAESHLVLFTPILWGCLSWVFVNK